VKKRNEKEEQKTNMFLMQEFLGCRLFLLLFSIEETIKRVQINVFFL